MLHLTPRVAPLLDQLERSEQVLFAAALASRWLTPLFQADRPLLARPRDAFLHPTARIPWVGRQMVATLGGSKTGPFGELPPGELP